MWTPTLNKSAELKMSEHIFSYGMNELQAKCSYWYFVHWQKVHEPYSSLNLFRIWFVADCAEYDTRWTFKDFFPQVRMGRLVVEQVAGEYNRRWTSKCDSLSASHFVGGLLKPKQIIHKYKG